MVPSIDNRIDEIKALLRGMRIEDATIYTDAAGRVAIDDIILAPAIPGAGPRLELALDVGDDGEGADVWVCREGSDEAETLASLVGGV